MLGQIPVCGRIVPDCNWLVGYAPWIQDLDAFVNAFKGRNLDIRIELLTVVLALLATVDSERLSTGFPGRGRRARCRSHHRNGLLKALARKDHQLVRDVMHRDIALVDASGGFPESGHLAAGEVGGSVPPSASVFMFCSACMNLARRASLSAARAASSGNIELSKNKV